MLAAEEELLDTVLAAHQPPTCRIWQTDRCIVVPNRFSTLPRFAVAIERMAALGWPVHFRRSGGSPVPLMPGILNLSFIYPIASSRGWSLEAAYRHLLAPLHRLLQAHRLPARIGEVPSSLCAGRFDLAIGGRKLAGTAQRRRSGGASGRIAVLAHATIWVAPDLNAACVATARFLHAMDQPAAVERNRMTSIAAETGDRRRTDLITDEFAEALGRVIRECETAPIDVADRAEGSGTEHENFQHARPPMPFGARAQPCDASREIKQSGGDSSFGNR